MPPATPLLTSIRLEGFLSFAPGSDAIPLTPLNVVIGPNSSGKSNLIEALSVLRAVPRDLPLPIRQGGGVRDWLWKPGTGSGYGIQLADGSGFGAGTGYGTAFADGSGAGMAAASLEVLFAEGRVATFQGKGQEVRYRLVFGTEGDSFVVIDERLENASPIGDNAKPYFYFGYENGNPMLNVRGENVPRKLRSEDIDRTQSILSQRRDPDAYPEITRLADLLGRVRIYRNWQFGPEAPIREACRADVRSDYLSEGFDNLPARLATLKRDPQVKRRLLDLLGELAPGFQDIEIVPEGGRLQLYLTENGREFPARRLSDGTLRYLCLLAILVDPTPAPLIVIEEPELGLHPDVLPTLRDLMVEASGRSQIIVTTHSTQLVDAMTEYSDSVLVCERLEDRTLVTRLAQAEVDRWREHGGLGNLWMEGHFGGTRW